MVEAPKYDTVLPAYFTPANLVGGTLVSAMSGSISGTVESTVYRNPQTGNLSFDYRFVRDSATPTSSRPPSMATGRT